MKPHLIIFGILAVCMLFFSCQKEQKPTNRSQAALVDFYGIPMYVDTLDIPVESFAGEIVKAIKFRDSYFLLIHNQHHYLDDSQEEILLKINNTGTSIDTISYDLNEDRLSFYNWFVNHDTLFISRYSDRNFFLDTDNFKWVPTYERHPIIYQDSTYEVTEGSGKGGVVYFKEKATNNYFEVGMNGSNQVYKVDTGYVVTSLNLDLMLSSSLHIIPDPKNCSQLDSTPDYEEFILYGKPTDGSKCFYGCNYSINVDEINTQTHHLYDDNNHLMTSFVCQNQTFHFLLKQGWHTNYEYFGKTENNSVQVVDSPAHHLRKHQNLYCNRLLFSGTEIIGQHPQNKETLSAFSPFLFETSDTAIHKTILRAKPSPG